MPISTSCPRCSLALFNLAMYVSFSSYKIIQLEESCSSKTLICYHSLKLKLSITGTRQALQTRHNVSYSRKPQAVEVVLWPKLILSSLFFFFFFYRKVFPLLINAIWRVFIIIWSLLDACLLIHGFVQWNTFFMYKCRLNVKLLLHLYIKCIFFIKWCEFSQMVDRLDDGAIGAALGPLDYKGLYKV